MKNKTLLLGFYANNKIKKRGRLCAEGNYKLPTTIGLINCRTQLNNGRCMLFIT